MLDEAPLLSGALIQLAVFMKEKYCCTLFDAIKCMLPSGANVRVVESYKINEESIQYVGG